MMAAFSAVQLGIKERTEKLGFEFWIPRKRENKEGALLTVPTPESVPDQYCHILTFLLFEPSVLYKRAFRYSFQTWYRYCLY